MKYDGNMISNLIRMVDVAFSCSHKHVTFPITPAGAPGCYQVCLDCGKELPYSWAEMRRA